MSLSFDSSLKMFFLPDWSCVSGKGSLKRAGSSGWVCSFMNFAVNGILFAAFKDHAHSHSWKTLQRSCQFWMIRLWTLVSVRSIKIRHVWCIYCNVNNKLLQQVVKFYALSCILKTKQQCEARNWPDPAQKYVLARNWIFWYYCCLFEDHALPELHIEFGQLCLSS